MKVKNIRFLLINLVISILVLVILSLILILPLYLPSLLHKMLALPPVWTVIVTILVISGFVMGLWFLGTWLYRTKRLLMVVSFCILEIGFVFVILSYRKDICWQQISWDPTMFGIAVTIFALGIAFLTLSYPRESEAVAIDKIINSNSKIQELTTKIQMSDKVVKELNNKMQQLNTKVQMIDKTAKDIDSKIQKLDTKIQMLIDKEQQKR